MNYRSMPTTSTTNKVAQHDEYFAEEEEWNRVAIKILSLFSVLMPMPVVERMNADDRKPSANPIS